MKEIPGYLVVFEQLRKKHPFPQAPNEFRELMFDLASDMEVPYETAEAYADKAKAWCVRAWKLIKVERHPLKIIDESAHDGWVIAEDETGRKWGIPFTTYSRVHEMFRNGYATQHGVSTVPLSALREISSKANERWHTNFKSIVPILIDPQTRRMIFVTEVSQ